MSQYTNKTSHNFRNHHGPDRQSGLSLIEVLVALLVLSIGLAGMAAMHLNSLKNVSSSYMRSLASTIALDFEERLWIEASVSDDLDGDGCPVPATVVGELQAAWSTTEPRWDWSTAERASLPNLTVTAGNATKSTSASNTVWIEIPVTVQWSETRFETEDEEEAGEEFTYTVRSLCRQSAVS